jgi:hypothetical protein
VTTLCGALTINCVPKTRAPHTITPIQNSHTASPIQALKESGGIVSGRHFHGLISGMTGRAIAYFHLLRVPF